MNESLPHVSLLWISAFDANPSLKSLIFPESGYMMATQGACLDVCLSLETGSTVP